MQLGSALSWFQRKAASPREDGDEEAAIDNPFPHGGSRRERRRSNQVNKLTAADLNGKSKQDLVTYFKNKYDSNGDGIFQDDEVEQMLLDTIEICESRAGLEVEKDMMLNKLRKMNRRMKIMGATGVVAIIASVLGTYFGSESTFSQGTVEVKDSIIKSKTTSVGLDNNGHSHLQDAKSGLDISTRGFGDTFHTEAKVDPSSRRKLICMTIEEIADLFQDTMSRTEASVVIVGEDGYEKQVVPIDGQFVDNGRTLHFGRGEDSVTMIMDSDVCNTAIPPADLDDIQVTFEEEEEVPYELDIDAAVQDASSDEAAEVEEAVPADDGIFNRARNLISRFVGVPSQVVDDPQANPDARVKVVDMSTSHGSTDKDPSRHLFSSSSSEVLARHRAEFEIAKRSPRGERKMQAGGSVEICSGDGCESTSCTISGVDSDGSAGNLILDENGNLSLNGNTNDPRFFDPTTLGTAPDVTTTFENIDNFIIAPGQTVNVIGTLIVKSKRTQIDGELNGNGGGYSGADVSTTADGEIGNSGESPLDTNGHGTGGMKPRGGHITGGGGGSHAGRGGRGGAVTYYSNRPFCSDLTSCPGHDSFLTYTSCCNTGGKPGDVYDDTLPLTLLRPGSGGGGGAGLSSTNGGAGGAGGAAIIFYSEEIVLNGNIKANGSNGGRGANNGKSLGGGGGGSGGSVSFSACTLNAGQSAKIEAKGGEGGQARNYGYGGGGGGGGIFSHESTTANYDDSMTINVDGGARGGDDTPSSDRRGFAGSAGKVFLLPSNLELEDDCGHPSYFDPTAPLDKNSRCATGICRTSDNKCGCDNIDDCLSSSELCHTDNKCYSSGLSIDDDQDCAAEDGTALNDRCTSGICRSSDTKCGCTSTDHCDSDSGEVCHLGDNKCYVSGLYGQDCSVDDGTALDARCLSNKCRSSDTLCGCTIDDHCLSSSEVCHTDNKCYSSGLSIGQSCAADNGGAVNARCASGFCRSSDDKTCRCTSNSHCPSDKVCHSDNKCYSSGLSIGQSCAADNGDALNSRCSSGFCRSSDDKTCRCTSNSHCPSDKVCKTSTNDCVTQQYRLAFNCDLECCSGETTGSRVSLDVHRGGSPKVWIPHMDKPGGCPDHTFALAGAEADLYQIYIYGSDALGVDSFTLYDATNGGKIKSWGAEGGGSWCLTTDGRSNCWRITDPNRGVKLYKDGSSERIRFGSGTRCKKNGACINSCKAGGGSCGITKKCCT